MLEMEFIKPRLEIQVWARDQQDFLIFSLKNFKGQALLIGVAKAVTAILFIRKWQNL